ncbi:sigma factor-like helix-turn-helix DNA-binding protein [Brevundimonas sp. BR2-1]|uniref:RNA polymerase sigma factor n=1 Tax=Brevundimonas sp. BR2-1 TaxID=3031123 RepID=UPI00309A2CCB
MNLGWFRGWRGFWRAAEPYGRRVLARAIRQLPSDCRDVFALHRFANMPLDEIAAHLWIDRAVAEARLAEALVQLCRAVDEAEARQSSERP